jgi:hypothetical protein
LSTTFNTTTTMKRTTNDTWAGLGGTAVINPHPAFISDATGRKAIPLDTYLVFADGINTAIGVAGTLADAAQLLRDRKRGVA